MNMILLRLLAMVVLVFLPNRCDSKTIILTPGYFSSSKSAGGARLQPLSVNKVETSVKARLKKNDQKTLYFGWVEVGTPPQKLLICFDTGSSDFWVLSAAICKNDKSYCKKHRTYDKTKSKTFKKDGRPFHVEYLLGETKGIVVRDDISVSGLKVKQQIFAEATELSNDSMAYPYDGVLGLAFTALSQIPADPPFLNMIKQEVVKQPVFSFYLSKNKSNAELSLGEVDSKHFTGTFIFAPVASKYDWLIKLDKMHLGKTLIGASLLAIPDSGTTNIVGPQKIIEPINKAIGTPVEGDPGWYAVNCSQVKSLPNITFEINKTAFTLEPEYYIIKTYSGKVMFCWSSFETEHSYPHVILGSVFMQKYYTQFDMGQRRIGFALAK